MAENTQYYLDKTGVASFRAWTKEQYASKDYESAVDALSGAQENVIEGVQVNGSDLTVTNKKVNVTVPTTVASLTDAGDYAKTADLPTKLTDLTNDGDFVTDANYVHTDNNLTTTLKTRLEGIAEGAEVNVIEGVTVNGADATIASKKAVISVPTTVAELTDAASYALAADVPTTVAELTDASDYLQGADIAAWAKASVKPSYTADEVGAYTTAQTDTAISSAISSAVASVMEYKGVKVTVGELPASGAKVGDVWHVTADSGEYAWNGESWEELGSSIDLSDYALRSELPDIQPISASELEAILNPSA